MKNLKKYIDKTFTWKIDNYKFPKEVPSSRVGKWINIEELREERLRKHRSNHESKFIFDISPHKFSLIHEFPIPIHNRKLWFEKVNKFSVPPKFQNIFCFSLDFFFPYTSSGIVVEIDGSQHFQQKEYDMARDEYLKDELGLEVLRAKEYGDFNPKESKSFFSNLIQRLYSDSQDIEYMIDFSEGINYFFKEKYKYNIKLIERINMIYKKEKVIYLTRKELRNLSEVFYVNVDEFNKLLYPLTNKLIRISNP